VNRPGIDSECVTSEVTVRWLRLVRRGHRGWPAAYDAWVTVSSEGEFDDTVPEDSADNGARRSALRRAQPEPRTLGYYTAAGAGFFPALLACLAYDWVPFFGSVPLIIHMAFWYSFVGVLHRGWNEYFFLHGYVLTVISYGSIKSLLHLSLPGFIMFLITIVATYVVFMIAGLFVVSFTLSAQKRNDRYSNARRSLAYPDRPDSWEERHFFKLRAVAARGGSLRRAVLIRLGLIGLITGYISGISNSQENLLYWLGSAAIMRQGIVLWRLLEYSRRLELHDSVDRRQDSRASILFLRPFRLDAFPIIASRWYHTFLFLELLKRRTLEQVIADMFKQSGPLIALGRPGEKVAPLGAQRQYVEEWRHYVLDTARAAELILIVVADSPGMMWELENIPEVTQLDRVILLLPALVDFRDESWRRPELDPGISAKLQLDEDAWSKACALIYDRGGQAVKVISNKENVVDRLLQVKKCWNETNFH
jgi:hypothetical protein